MSVFLDRCDEIKTHLETVFASDDVIVLADRKKDIESEFTKAIGKVKGGVIVVEWAGATSAVDNSSQPWMSNRFFVTIICQAMLRNQSGNISCDDLAQKAAGALQHWHPTPESPSSCQRRMQVNSILPVSNPNFLIYQITATMPLIITAL